MKYVYQQKVHVGFWKVAMEIRDKVSVKCWRCYDIPSEVECSLLLFFLFGTDPYFFSTCFIFSGTFKIWRFFHQINIPNMDLWTKVSLKYDNLMANIYSLCSWTTIGKDSLQKLQWCLLFMQVTGNCCSIPQELFAIQKFICCLGRWRCKIMGGEGAKSWPIYRVCKLSFGSFLAWE